MADDTKPKCCPFCGCAMKITHVGRDWWRIEPEVWHLDECPIDGQEFDYTQAIPSDEAVDAWNMRSE